MLPGGRMLLLIPNDFFTRIGNENARSHFTETHIQALIALPNDLFKSIDVQKSILILQKRGENVDITKDILVFNFPSFNDQQAVQAAIVKLENWFKQAHI